MLSMKLGYCSKTIQIISFVDSEEWINRGMISFIEARWNIGTNALIEIARENIRTPKSFSKHARRKIILDFSNECSTVSSMIEKVLGTIIPISLGPRSRGREWLSNFFNESIHCEKIGVPISSAKIILTFTIAHILLNDVVDR
jgi:hypothetical protein